MLVVSTIDPNPSLQDDSSKQESSECCSFESPSKRIRLASGDDEPGPCDSADEAAVTAAAGEPKLTRSDELPATPLLSPLSLAVRVLRLSCEAREVRDSREPVPSLLKAEYVCAAS